MSAVNAFPKLCQEHAGVGMHVFSECISKTMLGTSINNISLEYQPPWPCQHIHDIICSKIMFHVLQLSCFIMLVVCLP